MIGRKLPVAVGALSALCLGASNLAAHPLDPLSADELKAVVEILAADGLGGEAIRFPHVRLQEPPKAEVLAWHPGDAPPPRRAFAVSRRDGAIARRWSTWDPQGAEL